MFGQQLGAERGDELGELVLERVDLAGGECAQVRELLACDPDPCASWLAAQLTIDAVKRPRLVERFELERGLELRAQLDQMPANPVHGPGALSHEIVAVIEQQPDLHRLLV